MRIISSHQSPASLRDQVIELQKKYIMPCVETWLDIVFVQGKGTTLWDSEGKSYIDCFSGVSVLNVGHCHPKVVNAVIEQAKKLTHLTTLYYTENMPRLAEKLSKIAPTAGQGKVFFCNSGSEANELAVILSKKFTGRGEVIGIQGGFYGRTGTTMSLSGLGAWRAGLGPFMPGIIHAPSFHCYRCPLGHFEGPPACGYACAQYIESMFKTQLSAPPAAFIAEPIQGVAGCVPAPPEYFKVAKEILDRYGVLLVADEVQTGFGRTGKMFALEHYGVKADIVTLAKALGGGFPIGAIVARAEIADCYHGPHFSTFGGNPVSCTAALAAIEVLEEERLVENSQNVGDKVLDRLEEISARSRILDDVQGKGLMISAEVVTDKKSRKPASGDVLDHILRGCAKDGVVVGRGGLYYNRIRFQPPLCISEEQADKAIDAFERNLRNVESNAS